MATSPPSAGPSDAFQAATAFVTSVAQASSTTLVSSGTNVRGLQIMAGAIFDGTYLGAGDYSPVESFPIPPLRVEAGVALTVERITASPGNRVVLKAGSNILLSFYKKVTGAADSVGGQIAYKVL